jgi:hypothetical protein
MKDKNHFSNISQFPAWEEIRQLMDGKFDILEEQLLIERIKSGEPVDDFSHGFKNYLEDNNYDVSDAAAWTEFAKQKIKTSKPKQTNPIKWIRYAAAIAAIVSFSFIYYYNYYNKTGNENWVQYYENEPGFSVKMSKKGKHDEWMQAYRMGDYELALHKINNAEQLYGKLDTFNFYKSIILFNLSDYNQALSELNDDNLLSSIKFRHDLIYMKAFCHWALKNNQMAKSIFEEISNDNESPYKETADKVLRLEFSEQIK